MVYYSYAGTNTHHLIGYYVHHAGYCYWFESHDGDFRGVMLVVGREPERLEAVVYGNYRLDARAALRRIESERPTRRSPWSPDIDRHGVSLLPRRHSCAGKPCVYERPGIAMSVDIHRFYPRWDHGRIIGHGGIGRTQAKVGHGYILTPDGDASSASPNPRDVVVSRPRWPRHRYLLQPLDELFSGAVCAAGAHCADESLYYDDDPRVIDPSRISPPRILYRLRGESLHGEWGLAGTLPWGWGENDHSSRPIWHRYMRHHVCEAHPLRELRRSNLFSDPARVIHDHLRWPTPGAFHVPRSPWCYETLPGLGALRELETLCAAPSYAGPRGTATAPICK